MITRQRLHHLRRPQTYREAAIDLLWSLPPRPATLVPLSFDLDPVKPERAEIRWPTVYQESLSRAVGAHPRDKFRRVVDVVPVTLAQLYQGIIVFPFVYRGAVHDVVFDLWDHLHINAEAGRRCSLYFKLQHLAEGYPSEKVIAGGFLQHRDPLNRFPASAASSPAGSTGLPLRRIRTLPSAVRHRRPRGGRPRAVRARSVPVRRRRQEGQIGESLRAAARSKVCIDLPGNGPFCYRLIDYLAIGSCVVARRHETVLQFPSSTAGTSSMRARI